MVRLRMSGLVLAIGLAILWAVPAAAIDLDELRDGADALLDDAERGLDDAGRAAGRVLDDVERGIDAMVDRPVTPATGWLAGDLLGAPVSDPAGERIAQVADLVVDREGGVPLALLRIDGRFRPGGALAAIAFADLALAEGATPEAPAFTMTREDLEALPAWRIDEDTDAAE